MQARHKKRLMMAAALTLALLTLWLEYRQPPEQGRMEDTAIQISTTMQSQADCR